MSGRQYILDLFGAPAGAASHAIALTPTFIDAARDTLRRAERCSVSVVVHRNVRFAAEISAELLTVSDALESYLDAVDKYETGLETLRNNAAELRELLESWEMFAAIVGPAHAAFLTDFVRDRAAITVSARATQTSIYALEMATAEAVAFRPAAKKAEHALAETVVFLRRFLPGSIVRDIFVMVGTSPY
jgi:hypothetical protein